MHFVPKFYKLVPVNFNFNQCLYVAFTGISGVGTGLLELFYILFKEVLLFVHREFLWQVEVIGYFTGYFIAFLAFSCLCNEY